MKATWMNREQRRLYLRKMKTDKNAELCPACGQKARHLTVPGEDGMCDVACEYCAYIVRRDVRGHKPGDWVKLEEVMPNDH